MNSKSLERIVIDLPPKKAIKEIARIIKSIFPLLEEQDQIDFMTSLIGETGNDKVTSLVHLWLAECMDEGVDPTRMCQSLVNKVFHSKQIKAVADPEILTLFEDWLEELEEEVVAEIHKGPQQDPLILAERLGLSKSGAAFLMAKLKREERI